MVLRDELRSHLQQLLGVDRFRDYGPNGLQIEGRAQVRRLVSGVTASLQLIEAAVHQRADAILVHHGLFWDGQDGCITGWLRARVALLMAHDINLYAYHLPLDDHPEHGNNAQFGSRLGLVADARFGEQGLGFAGVAGALTSLDSLVDAATGVCERGPTVVPGDGRALRRIGWCTGSAQDYFEAAIAAGVDAYVTGEISEPQAHVARETGVAFVACGHHATERFGAPALGQHLASVFGLEHCFIDVPNPA
jgi:dinuclear metal center YbgI/SA1388 family protein